MGSYDVEMRWADMDAQGHINNVAFVDYLQEARTQFLLSGPLSYLLSDGVVVVWHQVEYCRELNYSTDPIQIEVGITKIGGSLFELGYLVTENGHLIAKAASRLCPFDFEKQQPARLAPTERAWFESQKIAFPGLSETKFIKNLTEGHQFKFKTRWSDLDSYGHVNNTNFYEYIQEARIAMTTELVPQMARAGTKDLVSNYLWLIKRQDVKYLRQIEFSQTPYTVTTGIRNLGNTSITLAAQITSGTTSDAYAVSNTVLVCVDKQTNKPCPLPPQIRAELAKHVVAAS